MNDPNGLCFDDGLWHAFYQHDATSLEHGVMHWAHATSPDLRTWDHHPIALYPDELGVIFSGSVVVDEHDTAGFGPGAMIAVFTHDLDAVQVQSLAFSNDGGFTWEKFEGNPVLTGTEKDFRDPKVLRHDDRWVMALAVGDRIDFYESADLRHWELGGSYTFPLDAKGVWECPDLIRLPDSDAGWALIFSVVNAGPHGHCATLIVDGSLAGSQFVATSEPRPLDHGPDFYATQSFHAAPGDDPIVMAWMSSWSYATKHPHAGRRGVQSIPRRLRMDDAGLLCATPMIEPALLEESTLGSQWQSRRNGALHVRTDEAALSLVVSNDAGPVATVEITARQVTLTRHVDVVDGYAQQYEAELTTDGSHEILIDHGTLEVFCDDGRATISALIFPGEQWSVRTDRDVHFSAIN